MSKITQFSADLALKQVADDRLDRKRFSIELARALAGWTGNESLVVSLCGDWGSGKTTLKNFITEELEKKSPKPIVGEFNPWQWSGQDKLLEGFLSQLATLLGKPEIANRTDNLLRKYKMFAAAMSLGTSVAGAARPVFGPFFLLAGANLAGLLFLWGFSSTAVVSLTFAVTIVYAILSQIPGVFDSFLKFLEAKHASQHKSLEELRQDVGREMAKLDRVVIVFIDDIDRLTDREIRLLFQLVKANVHFPNLIYCLLYQKDIVATSLGKIISDGGDKYLRKIVQVQFDVPLPSKRQLQKILTDDLQRILAQKDIEIVQDIERWNQLFPDPLWGYFENVRDVKRFLGSFEFYFNMHLNGNVLEVNPIDLVAVEALRMFDHPAFQSVGGSFFRRGIEAFNLLDNDKVAEDFAAEIKLIVDEGNRDQQKKRRLDETLHFLFPQAKNNARDGCEHEWLSKLRICHASHFDKYFQVNLSPGQPSARDLLFLVENSRDRSKLVKTLNESISKGSIGDFLEFIMAARDRIPAESLTSFVTALFDIADSFPHGFSLLGNDLQMDCLRIIFQRLKNETVEMRTTILWNALEATTGIGLPIRLLASEDHIKRARGTGEEFLIEEKDVQRFCAAALIKIRAIAERGTLLDSEYAAAILYRWKDWTDGTEVRTWVQKTIQTPRDARRLLTKLIAKSYIGTRMEPLLHSEAIEVFTPIETLLAAVEKSDGTSPSEEETVSIGLLTRAVELKRAGKPFAEIRPRDSRY